MEPVEILGGHPVYEKTTREAAIKIFEQWDGTKGTKPWFRSLRETPSKELGKYKFEEIEKRGKLYQRKGNPLGLDFKNVLTRKVGGLDRRNRLKKSLPTRKEVFAIYKKSFPEAPKKQIDALVKWSFEQDKLRKTQLQAEKLRLEKLYGKKFATDHIQALALDKPFSGWFTNLANIEDDINLFKSAKEVPAEFLKDRGLLTPEDTILKTLRSEVKFDKPGSMEWNKSMAKYFDPKSSTFRALGGQINKAIKPIKPVAKFIPYAGAAFTLAAAKSDIQAAETDPTWQNKLQAKLSTMDIWLEGSELATGGFTSPVTTPLQIGSTLLNIGIGMTEPGYKVTKEEQEKEIRKQTEGGKYDFTAM